MVSAKVQFEFACVKGTLISLSEHFGLHAIPDIEKLFTGMTCALFKPPNFIGNSSVKDFQAGKVPYPVSNRLWHLHRPELLLVAEQTITITHRQERLLS